MKEKIEEIQNYFVSKIESGDFQLIKVGNHSDAFIEIYGYEFHYFYSRDKVYSVMFDNFMELPEIKNGAKLIEAIKENEKDAKLKALKQLQDEIAKL